MAAINRRLPQSSRSPSFIATVARRRSSAAVALRPHSRRRARFASLERGRDCSVYRSSLSHAAAADFSLRARAQKVCRAPFFACTLFGRGRSALRAFATSPTRELFYFIATINQPTTPKFAGRENKIENARRSFSHAHFAVVNKNFVQLALVAKRALAQQQNLVQRRESLRARALNKDAHEHARARADLRVRTRR